LGRLLNRAIRQVVVFVRRHHRPLQYAFSGAILLFLGLYVYRNARALSSYEFSLNASSLGLASGLVLIVVFLTPLAWGLVLRTCLDIRLSWREALRIWSVSQVSKYLPGSVWNYVSRVYLCNQSGIPTSKAVLSMVLEVVLMLLAQALAFLLSLPFWLSGSRSLLWVLAILPLGLVALHPRVFNGLLTLVARRSGMEKAPQASLTPRTVGGLLAVYLLDVVVVGLSFFFFANSLYPIPLSQIPILIGMLNLSLIVGFLAPFAPYGLGVREGLLTVLLSQYGPTPVAALISLASRLWFTLSELVGLVVALMIHPSPPNNPKGLCPQEDK
jgi:hypothetical protein